MTVISPYLAAAARRASIQIVALNSPIAAVSAGRAHIPLLRSGPAIEPAWHSWLAGALTFLAIAIVVILT